MSEMPPLSSPDEQAVAARGEPGAAGDAQADAGTPPASGASGSEESAEEHLGHALAVGAGIIGLVAGAQFALCVVLRPLVNG